MWELLEEAATNLIADCSLQRTDEVDTHVPRMGGAWSISGMIAIRAELGDRYPACADDLTPEMKYGLEQTEGKYGEEGRARLERRRTELNHAMSRIFDPVDGVDFVLTAANPDVAFDAEGPLPSVFGGIEAGRGNNGQLTFPANLHGNPGDLGSGRFGRRPPDRAADRRAPFQRAAAAGPRSDDGAQSAVAAHGAAPLVDTARVTAPASHSFTVTGHEGCTHRQ